MLISNGFMVRAVVKNPCFLLHLVHASINLVESEFFLWLSDRHRYLQ